LALKEVKGWNWDEIFMYGKKNQERVRNKKIQQNLKVNKMEDTLLY
jgi:hypothetical protein